jgi:mono/diheme cytochrome c family protein
VQGFFAKPRSVGLASILSFTRDMRFLIHAAVTLAALALVALVVGYLFTRNGLSAQTEPPAIEAAVARRIRSLSIPAGAKARVNPFAKQASAWIEGGSHFQEHCSVCHGDEGDGKSEIGRNLYPKAPDMRQAATQELTDGELYFVITNGIRYTGMPAWEGEHTPEETWKLVSFIRRLPRLTPEDVEKVQGVAAAHKDE